MFNTAREMITIDSSIDCNQTTYFCKKTTLREQYKTKIILYITFKKQYVTLLFFSVENLIAGFLNENTSECYC